MTPDQLKYLTDEERRAWEACGAATPGPWDDELDTDRKAERNNWREVYAGNRPVVVSDCYERHSAGETETVCGVRVSAPDAALIALSRTALPAALEALADARAARDVEEQLRCVADDERARAERDAEDARRERDAYKRAKAENDERFMCERDQARRERDQARRERDEARAELAAMEQRIHARISRNRGVIVHLTDEDGDISDVETVHSLERENKVLARFLTPGGDPAPRGAGAPDAAGGALGVGCSLCRHLALADAPKADVCPLCGAAVSKGGALGVGSACTYSRAWIGPCGKPGDHGRCPEHALVVCSCCGTPATGECPQTGGLVCGFPLCDDCEHDPKPGWHCAHRRKPGALGVGLTNCDNCANDYLIDGRRMCRRVDALWANFRAEREAADELDEWVAGNTNEDGAPLPGATGCPGWAKRGEG